MHVLVLLPDVMTQRSALDPYLVADGQAALTVREVEIIFECRIISRLQYVLKFKIITCDYRHNRRTTSSAEGSRCQQLLRTNFRISNLDAGTGCRAKFPLAYNWLVRSSRKDR